MEEQDQLDKLYQATEKALEQVEKERNYDNRDYIIEWFRWVELTGKYFKNKLN